MIFRPELAEKVLSGEKTVTRRLTSPNPRSPWYEEECAYRVGGGPDGSYAVQPGRGKPSVGRIRVVSAMLQPLLAPSDAEARREGFRDAGHFAWAWREINGETAPGTSVWRVEFELV